MSCVVLHTDSDAARTTCVSLFARSVQGKYEEAVPLLEHCVDSGQRVLGEDHYLVATFMENLANELTHVSMQQSVSTGFVDVCIDAVVGQFC